VARTTIGAATAAIILLAAAPMALAQGNSTASPPADSATQAGPAVPHRVMPGQIRFSQMNGATIYGAQDKSVGDVNNVVLDPHGRIAAVVVKTGGFLGLGGKTLAVSMHDLKITTNKNGTPHIAIDMTQQQLKSAQAYDLTPPNNNANAGSGGSMTPLGPKQQ